MSDSQTFGTAIASGASAKVVDLAVPRTANPELLEYFSASQTGTSDERQPDLRPASKIAAQQRRLDVTPAQRYAIKHYLADALAHALNMEEAASADDKMRLATEGVGLVNNLSDLWRLRRLRDDEWAEIINFLQAVLAKIEFEVLTHEQCTSLRLIIEGHLRPDANDDDVEATIGLLERAGFNAWRGITEPE